MKEKKNKRTKKTAVAAVGMALVLAVGGIFAFMSDHDNAINKFNFTDKDGNQSIDIQLTETEWNEENGKNIVYGKPVAKNPVATNIGENEMYAFATVIVPAKAVTVQNASGQLVDVNDATYANLAAAGLTTTIVNNVSAGDKAADEDETEIKNVYRAATVNEISAYNKAEKDRTDAEKKLAENVELVNGNYLVELAFGEEVPGMIYFKLNNTSPYGTSVTDGDETFKILIDELDADTYTSKILGHQFMLKFVQDENATEELSVRELYTFETVDDDNNLERVISGKWTEHENDAGEVDGSKDELSVYSRGKTHEYKAGVDTDVEGWVEITDRVNEKTVYIDGEGRIYSAHVFYYSTPLAKSESTLPIFDYVELLNVTEAQIEETDDMNIYVETYGVQTNGLADAITATTKDEADDVAEKADAYSDAKKKYDQQKAIVDAMDGTEANYDEEVGKLGTSKSTLDAAKTSFLKAKEAYEAQEGVSVWSVLTSAEDEFSFDIFGVVKGSNKELTPVTPPEDINLN